MTAQLDPRMVDSAADLAVRYGADAITFARHLAWEHEDPEVSAYWGGVLALLVMSEQQARTINSWNSDLP